MAALPEMWGCPMMCWLSCRRSARRVRPTESRSMRRWWQRLSCRNPGAGLPMWAAMLCSAPKGWACRWVRRSVWRNPSTLGQALSLLISGSLGPLGRRIFRRSVWLCKATTLETATYPGHWREAGTQKRMPESSPKCKQPPMAGAATAILTMLTMFCGTIR